MWYIKYGKRIFDFVLSLMGLIILSPLFVVIALLIKFSDNGPIFFKQERVGQNFKPFLLIKFRSMVVNADKSGVLITSDRDSRITKIGRFLRKTKLDELPQLFNVLTGDMTLVGPRPEVLKYVELFKEDYMDILRIKPGITDHASIEFRDEEEVLAKYDNPEIGYVTEILPRKIKLYKKYIKEMGFLTDIKLIFLTLWKIVK